jgi:hypothetical protein
VERERDPLAPGRGEPPRPADRAGESRGGAPDRVLALQRQAGNRAVVSALRLQRKVEMRDVGRGEASGFARVPELIERMTTMSPSLIFSLDGKELKYEQVAPLTPNNFDTQMMALIDLGVVLPLRFTNHEGLLGDKVSGFHAEVDADAFTSGYVDIDDLLASTDLGLQSLLVHFLTERAATKNYARRIGTNFTQAEFNAGHAKGIEAEAALLRDFFGDPSIKIIADSVSPTVRRVFRNSKGDLIRRRIKVTKGVHASRIEVITKKDGKTLTADEYLAQLEAERAAAAAVAP